MSQSSRKDLERQFALLPMVMQEWLESVTQVVIEEVEREELRVSQADPADKLRLAIMEYIYDCEFMLENKEPCCLPPLISLTEGNC